MYSILGAGASGGGRAATRIRTNLLVVPGTLPFSITYAVLTTPYLRNPPLGVISLPLLPIFIMSLLYSVL